MNSQSINELIKNYSAQFDYNKKQTAIILAAGHGKRIKSRTSKMLHKIWEIPTVERVYNAYHEALGDSNIIIVVGIKAEEVIKTVGRKESVIYVNQEVQNGTGHAVQVALDVIEPQKYDGSVYILPGDMGLINSESIIDFQKYFAGSETDMVVLTGMFEGKIEDNYYGRVIRVPEKNKKQLANSGKVIEIMEYKDIISLDESKPYSVNYKGKKFEFTKKELIANREFNSGVYAFKFKPLEKMIKEIGTNNVQNEMYLTDLIYLFNKSGLSVSAVSPKDQYVLMGFNNKSVLKEMDNIARSIVYEKLKDLVEISDPDDFFIDESVVDDIIELDKKGIPLDIKIGKGAYVGKGVKVNYNLTIMKNVFLSGQVEFGKYVTIKDNAQLSCFYGQKIELGDRAEIFSGNIIKGNVKTGSNSVIESGVRITGSDECPTQIGDNVTIKGITYLFGSIIENNIQIEHSVLVKKRIYKPENSKQEIYKVKYYLPEAEGLDAIEDLKK
ncbi:MAG: NTP transferase domain-containing protein [Melioribacter sp.]|nr:NTP transferase domain-containing protein [Melioribacter sp.]